MSQLGWGWIACGLAGSLTVTVVDADLLTRRPNGWFFALRLHTGTPMLHHIFWLGVVALCGAWLGIGRRLSAGSPHNARALLATGLLWSLPLLLGPVLFSRDVYSYIADGALLHAGLNPYVHPPAGLAGVHQTGVLTAVSPFWRHTTAPYGPAFVGLASVVAGAAGSHLTLAALLMRGLALPGLVLLAVFVPRLARKTGADPARATWLAVVSPLVLLELIAAGHNDALMAGLLVAGVCLAMERRPLAGIAICMLAAMVKLPAAAGVLLILLCWVRAEPERAWPAIAQTAIVVFAIAVVVSFATGVGFHWISSGVLSTPNKVRIAITPATAAGYSLASVAHSLGIAASSHAAESMFGVAAAALLVALAGFLCWRVRFERLPAYLGALLLASVFAGPATWPWYLTWGAALLAGITTAQRSRALIAMLVVSVLVILPGGVVAIKLPHAPYTFAAYAAIALGAAFVYRRQLTSAARSLVDPPPGAAAVLGGAESG
jgi:Glycosyltransferase family 87